VILAPRAKGLSGAPVFRNDPWRASGGFKSCPRALKRKRR
jgi:hypothetical protein